MNYLEIILWMFELSLMHCLESYIHVSIIIPVYNSETFLDRCIQSALNQTIKEIEVICVDDSSTDNSLKILKKYEKKDRRLKTVHLEENKGPSVARNTGLELANGEFIGFMDSDDYADVRYFENLYNNSKDFDIVIGNFADGVTGSKYYYVHKESKIWGFVYDSIWRRNFINKYHIRFPENLREMEDRAFRTECYKNNPRKIELLDNGIYYYYKRRLGSVRNFSKNFLKRVEKKAKREKKKKLKKAKQQKNKNKKKIKKM